MSPTVLKYGPYRFYFWSNEADRPHVHCDNGKKSAKYWLEKAGEQYGHYALWWQSLWTY